MTHPGDPRTASQAALNYQKAVDLEKHLLTSLQSKGPFDPNVRILRDNIRELYECIILDDHEFAESHDVEQHIWRLHHTRIDDFRARIRKSMASANSVSTTAAGVSSGNKSGGRRDPVHKILAVFRSFLAEATGFYHDLILKIKAKHGLSQDDLYLEENTESKHDDKKVTELKRCQLSCHRCLIYLGDLARYKEYYGDGDATNRDWSIAAGFYVKAASLWPASGNPHNQLAVLATYVGDELLAVYHYFRSLAAETPFLTAKDNLIVFFEKNRHSYMRLVASFEKSSHDSGSQGQMNTGMNKGKSKVNRKSPSRAGDTKQKQSDQHYSEQTAVASNASEIVRSFRIRFVRLNGILFTRTSLETFAHVHSCVLSELKQLLTSKPKGGDLEISCNVLATGGMWGTGPNIVLQLVAILIFTVHNVNWGSDSQQPTYAEILQRSVILEHAFIATFECAGYIMQHCVDAGDASSSPFLPALLVIMEWLACRPEMALGTEIKEKEGNARAFFWKACVKLLNRLLEDDVHHDAKGSLKHFKEGNDIRLILLEDQELQGFTPLQPVQANLNYSKRSNVGAGNEKDSCTRVQRIIRAGKCVSLSFEGSENGIYYDDETDRFYCSGDKVKRDKTRDGDFVSTDECLVSKDLETPNEVTGFVSLNEKQVDSYLSRDVESSSPKLTSGEEEDEVIVFRPSAKLKQVNSDRSNVVDAVLVQKESADEICNSASLGNAQFSTWSQTKASESFGDNWSPSAPANILPRPLPSSVPSPLAILSPHVTRINALPLEPAISTVAASGSITEGECRNSLVDGDSMYMDSRSRDNSLSVGFPFASNVFESSYKVPNGASATPINAWGAGKEFGMFQSQHPWTPLPGNATYGTAGRSLWNPELHMLAAAKMFTGVGPNSSSSMPGGRIALADVFPNLKLTSESSPISSSEISNLLPISVVNDLQASAPFSSDIKNTLLDDIIKCQEANVMHKEDKPLNAQTGGYGQRESHLPANAALKPAVGSSSDTEKTVPRMAGRPTGMRPPPGFGPLPGKLSTTLPMTSTAPGSQSIGGQPVGTSVQPKVVPNSLLSLSGYEHVDDYGWLDGYTAPEREVRQVTNFGKVKSGGPSEYEMWTGGNSAANQGTLSPFPGMKVFDSFVNSPSLLQQQHQIAHLQQELFKNQQLHLEQERQQILQEHRRQQVQQLYNAQLIAQRDHLHAEQQLSSQEPLSLQQQQQQQQPPHPPWHGANSFVS